MEHGLAYLGVLLVLAGVFGLISYSFSDVALEWRPLVEVIVPLSLFGSAAYLRRSDAPEVAGVLSLAGGLLSAVVLLAAFVDGAVIPPDAYGWTRPVVLAASLLVLAGGQLAVVMRHPDSMLRYTVGPVVWLAAAMAALPLRGFIPDGGDLARAEAGQIAVTTSAVPVTAVLVRVKAVSDRWPAVVAATRTSAAVALVLLNALMVAVWFTDGWANWAAASTAAATAVALEVLPSRGARTGRPARLVGATQVILTVFAAGAACAPDLPLPGQQIGALGLAVLCAAIAAGEWVAWGRPSNIAAAVAVVAGGWAATMLLYVTSDKWVCLSAAVAVGWALTRHTAMGRTQVRQSWALSLVTGVGLLIAGSAAAGWLGADDGALAVGLTALALAGAGTVIGRLGADALLRLAVLTAFGLLELILLVDIAAERLDWWRMAAAGTVAVALVPGRIVARAALVAAGVVTTGLMVLSALDVELNGWLVTSMLSAAAAVVLGLIAAKKGAPLRHRDGSPIQLDARDCHLAATGSALAGLASSLTGAYGAQVAPVVMWVGIPALAGALAMTAAVLLRRGALEGLAAWAVVWSAASTQAVAAEIQIYSQVPADAAGQQLPTPASAGWVQTAGLLGVAVAAVVARGQRPNLRLEHAVVPVAVLAIAAQSLFRPISWATATWMALGAATVAVAVAVGDGVGGTDRAPGSQ